MLYVAVYDVSSNSRRTRLAKHLLDYGDRVQKSVFDLRLSERELQHVLAKSGKIIGAEDRLRVYMLCAACAERIVSLGPPLPEEEAKCIIV